MIPALGHGRIIVVAVTAIKAHMKVMSMGKRNKQALLSEPFKSIKWIHGRRNHLLHITIVIEN